MSAPLPNNVTTPQNHSVYDYAKVGFLIRGGNWQIFKAEHKETKKLYFVKRPPSVSRFEYNVSREIDVLKSLKHENIQALVDVTYSHFPGNTFLVLEYAKYNLAGVLTDVWTSLARTEIKCILVQMFTGLEYLHMYAVHGDMKPSNILIDDAGILKIANFHYAKKSVGPLSPIQGTLHYRAPETLFGFRTCNAAVDIWAAGCIFAELLRKTPLFPGVSELQQILLITNLLGNPNGSVQGLESALGSYFHLLKNQQPHNFISRKFPELSKSGVKLFKSMLLYEPSSRATASECLAAEYLTESPAACTPRALKFCNTCEETP